MHYTMYAFVYENCVCMIHHFSPHDIRWARRSTAYHFAHRGHRQWTAESSLPASHASAACNAMRTGPCTQNLVVNFFSTGFTLG